MVHPSCTAHHAEPCCNAGGPEFSYTSCMNQGEAHGSMEGAFSFAPGNLTSPSGPDFEALVRGSVSAICTRLCLCQPMLYRH
jgi:ApaG domain